MDDKHLMLNVEQNLVVGKLITSYFKELQGAIKELDPAVTANYELASVLNVTLHEFYRAQILDFDKALQETIDSREQLILA